MITGVTGPGRDAVAKYRQGVFTRSREANVASHFGVCVGDALAGVGTGGDYMGRGMGGGRGMGVTIRSAVDFSPPTTPSNELELLEAQARAAEEQIRVLKERMARLQAGGAYCDC